MNFKLLGFSLIELMVVITIVGLLSAIAVPAYKAYVIKVEMGRLYAILDSLRNTMVVSYQANGAYPTTFQYNGNTYGVGGWYEVNDNNFHWINVNVGETGRKDLVYVAGVPTAEMWQNMTGSPTLGQGFAIWSWENNGIMRTVCTDRHQYNSIPEAYLPAGCLVYASYPYNL